MPRPGTSAAPCKPVPAVWELTALWEAEISSNVFVKPLPFKNIVIVPLEVTLNY